MRRFLPSVAATALAVVLLFLAILPLSSCGREAPPPAASEVLAVMLEAMEDTAQLTPDGVIRLTAAPSDSPDCLTGTFLAALYGPSAHGLLGEGGEQTPAVMDVALFLSMTAYPCELAVFLCADGDTARAVAMLCQSRLDTVARGHKESPWAALAAGGRVAIRGNYVLLALCEDPEPPLTRAIGLLP
ncbi:MAG: hypothetical protein IJD38_00115 [Clostridia bacterium]|nr:hypothetical protein [Clostridia bacterium]